MVVPLLPSVFQNPYVELLYWLQPLMKSFTLKDIDSSGVYSVRRDNVSNPVSVQDIFTYYQSLKPVGTTPVKTCDGVENCLGINGSDATANESIKMKSFGAIWSSKVESLLKISGNQLEWNVCGRIGKDVIVSANGAVINDGYTCGLWMLFHYLTVASEINQQNINPISSSKYSIYYSSQLSARGIGALDVSHTIYTFVSYLFNCMTCQTHFKKDYQLCLHGRCMITKQNQYDLLQVSDLFNGYFGIVIYSNIDMASRIS